MRVTRSRYTTVGLVTLGLAGILAPTACGDGEVDKPPAVKKGTGGTGGEGGQAGGSGAPEAGQSGAAPQGFPVDAAAAEVAATLKLDAPFTNVVELDELTFGLGESSGASILDLSDAQNPAVVSSIATTGVAVGAALDSVNHVAYFLSASGDLRAWQVADPTHPVQVAKIKLKETAALGLARVADRLFVVGKRGITPVQTSFSGPGAMSDLTEQAPVAVSGSPSDVQVGAGQLYIAKQGGDVEVFNAQPGGAPKSVDSYSLGSEIVGWVARGTQIFTAIKDVGLKVLDFAEPGNTRVVYEALDEVSDVQAFKRSGNMAVVGLARGVTLALDVSTLSQPRALVSQKGALPQWIAASHGNFVLGTGKTLQVLGVPPFVSASLPSHLLSSFPRYGRIPLQLSKAVDPKTLTTDNVKLSCGGKVVGADVSIAPGNSRLTLLPQKTLPAGADCSVLFSGVTDPLGLPLSSPGPLGLTTQTDSGPVANPKSSYPHKADGAFTDWKPGMKGTNFEYGDVTAAQGMYSKFYADYDGARLWILNDWFYNGDAIEPDCYNQFEVYTGDNTQAWDIRAYGDQHVEVRLNGQLLAADDPSVTGGYSHAATPNDATPHTIYEIGVKTKPGAWSIQLSDPGPTFACNQLETDPTTYAGASAMDQTSIDPTLAPTTPAKPVLDRVDVSTLTPTLSWTTGDQAGNFTVYLFELTRDKFGTALFKQWVYGTSFAVPAGLLMYDTTYAWRVTGYNLAGQTPSTTATFSVPSVVDIVPPVLTDVQPSSVVQGTATTLSITGTGFLPAAQGFLSGGSFPAPVALATMYESDTALQVTLTPELTVTAGTYELTVQNAPDDVATASKPLVITVTVPQQNDTCPADPCSVGPRQDPAGCQCFTDVCADSTYKYCCAQSWDAACVERALTLKTCTCDTGAGGADGGVAGGTSGGGRTGVGGAGGAAGAAATGATGATAGTGGATCAANCADTYPLKAGPVLCDDASMTPWMALRDCACTTTCAQVCSLACSNMVSASESADQSCMNCITGSCTQEYGNCVADGVAARTISGK